MPDGAHGKIGHNTKSKKTLSPEDIAVGGVGAERLRSLVERIERLEEERKNLGADIKDIFVEAGSAGYDVKVLRQLIRIRKQDPDQAASDEMLLDTYRHALGM
jgi:uncharacterized protein (UPF0335 family)